ncbi:MAG TPA: signal recognition particle protein [Acholeplasmataceae bacterium]|nr:signal recognition particle protein [Acholeplasmataceae bacterium]
MPFESLSERIQMSLRRITGRGKLNEKDIDEMMREIRLSLLEADVNYKVVKKFTAEVKEKALGEKIMKSLAPGDMVVKVVHEELKSLMGDEAAPVVYKAGGLSTFMLVGLQGAGKTTHCGKIATFLRKQDHRKPIMIAADIYRPAAIDQLITVGKQLNIPVFSMGTDHKVIDIVKEGIKFAKQNGFDLAIIDTAGRLHIDELLMNELEEIVKEVEPDEILLTIDAMMGQDAINVITTFNEQLPITGCILTKLDGDTRGGAALSIRYLTNVPIKYIGVGEKLDQLEIFHPDRMAGRILGMGDVVSLVEKASDAVSEEEAAKLAEKMQKGKFDYDDFLKQIKMIKRMGSIKGLLGMIPGIGKQIKGLDIDEKQFVYIEAIIKSMTTLERQNPQLLAKSSSRRERIAKGSGRPYPEVNGLTKRFEDMKKQMQMVSNMGEDDIKKQALNKNKFNSQPTKQKKGKGKGRGNFRF